MLTFLITHSDQIILAVLWLAFLALLIMRPRVTCCRRRRWERGRPTGPAD
jgi:hypothetical protein